jgi:hypothetical protein
MASVSITLNGLDDTTGFGMSSGAVQDQRRAAESVLAGIAAGAFKATNISINPSSTDAVFAQAEVTATTSGSLGTVINGTTVTTAFTSSQAGTATQAIADINANATVNKFVRASVGSVSTKFYVTAVLPGALGNCCTLTVTGTGASATGSGKLIGGTGVDGAPTTYTL